MLTEAPSSSQLRFVVNFDSALSGSASLELQDEGDSAPGETNKLWVVVSVTVTSEEGP